MCLQNNSTLQKQRHLTTCFWICLQKGGNRPPTAKPKDPSELNIEDEELAKDYRKMYERFTEMEAKMAALLTSGTPQQKDIPDLENEINDLQTQMKLNAN